VKFSRSFHGYGFCNSGLKSVFISTINDTPHVQSLAIGKVNFIPNRISEYLNGVLGFYLVKKRDTIFYFITVKGEVTWHNQLL
jgi:hypothetical protein